MTQKYTRSPVEGATVQEIYPPLGSRERRDEQERSPIYQAIDNGGGQTCDIAGVIRTLNAAGYVIARKDDIGVLSAEEIVSGWERFASSAER